MKVYEISEPKRMELRLAASSVAAHKHELFVAEQRFFKVVREAAQELDLNIALVELSDDQRYFIKKDLVSGYVTGR